ncbi:uncharacterized protein LOC143376564 [Andrena cerasifolii]|uniref:uncharacterized protein LOC143376564 n=1 Tax=Andrena cerasifolii TaxID=2819439 RepID=UPI004038336C
MEDNELKGGKICRKQKDQLCQNYKKLRATGIHAAGPSQYVFYVILNTDLHLDQGTAAAAIARGLILLYTQLDCDQVKCQYVDKWIRNGRRIIILKGYDHKHLKYLEEEVKFLALGSKIVRQSWSRNKEIVVLAIFGQREELDEAFAGLSYLR